MTIIIVLGILIFTFSLSPLLKLILNTPIPLAVVSSYSMEPTLHVGDLILVIGVDSSSINIGDIIIYFDRGEPIVHRVIDVKVVDGIRRFLTKGDANSMPDRNPNNPHIWVPEDSIAGKVVLVIPYLGVVSLAVSTNKYLYVIIIFLLIISIVLSMIPYPRKKG